MYQHLQQNLHPLLRSVMFRFLESAWSFAMHRCSATADLRIPEISVQASRNLWSGTKRPNRFSYHV